MSMIVTATCLGFGANQDLCVYFAFLEDFLFYFSLKQNCSKIFQLFLTSGNKYFRIRKI